MKPRLVVFASGTKEGGGSGFENIVNTSRSGILDADIVGVVSNHEHGGVRKRADRLGIPFIYFDPSQHSNILKNVGMLYREIIEKSGAEWAALSGWFKQVHGLDSAKTFNIHPALLSQLGGRFGGRGMYGKQLHESVKSALDAGEIAESGFTMHFVTEKVDRGPVFFEYKVPLQKGMSTEKIEKAVRAAEHEWQPKITNMVVHGQIRWDGKDPKTLVVPTDFK